LSHVFSLFCFSYFSDRVLLSAWTVILLYVLPGTAGMTGVLSHLLKWGLTNFLPMLALNHDPPNHHLQSS
jgi:hypothetical protein